MDSVLQVPLYGEKKPLCYSMKHSPFSTSLIAPRYSLFIALESYLLTVFSGAIPVFVIVVSWQWNWWLLIWIRITEMSQEIFLDFWEVICFERLCSLPLTAHIMFWSPCWPAISSWCPPCLNRLMAQLLQVLQRAAGQSVRSIGNSLYVQKAVTIMG